MKKLNICLAILIALAASSCRIDEATDNMAPRHFHTVTVTVDKMTASKTAVGEVVDGEMNYIWTSGDESRMHIYENGVEATSISMALSEGDHIATFTATFADSNASEYAYSAVYGGTLSEGGSAVIPYLQKPAEGSFDPNADVLVSASDVVSQGTPASSLQFSLVRQAAVSKMTLKGLASGETLQSVVLSSPDKEFVSGSANIVLDCSALEIATGSDIPLYFVTDAVSDASFAVTVMTDKAIYQRDNFTSKLTFEPGTLRQFGLQLGSYRHDGGTEGYPWLIANKDDLQAVHDRMIADKKVYFRVIADIDMTGEEWVPLNNSGTFNKFIDFDGGGYTVSNLTPKSGEDYPSLFGVMYGDVYNLTIDRATITPGGKKSGVFAGYIGTGSNLESCRVENVTVSNSSITGSTTYAGGFAGQVAANNVQLSGISVINTTVNTSSFAGGVVAVHGGSNSRYEDIVVSGSDVTGGNNTGGLIGEITSNSPVTVTGVSVIETSVSGKLTGGLIGYMNSKSTVTNCLYEGGTVSAGAQYCGGLIARAANYQSTISNCAVKDATVTSTADRVGGFVGHLQESATISHCSVEDLQEVKGSIQIGGFAGVNYGTIEYCSSSAASIKTTNTTTDSDVTMGGFVGFQAGSISNSSASSTISNQTGRLVGGFIGNMLSYNSSVPSVTNCSSSAEISMNSGIVGGFAGNVQIGVMEACTAKGNVTLSGSEHLAGGMIGRVNTASGVTVTVNRCSYTDGSVTTASSRYAGGLIATKQGDGELIVSNCYVTGNVEGKGGWAGGLLAQHSAGTASLENCYVTGAVKASWGAGGIVGQVSAAGLSVVRCMPFNSEIKATATDSNAHYSSGAVIAYGKSVNLIVDWCYRRANIANDFADCPANSANVIEQHSFITTAGTIPQRKSLTYGYYHHGRNTAMTLCNLVHSGAIGVDWSSDIWDWSGSIPVLKNAGAPDNTGPSDDVVTPTANAWDTNRGVVVRPSETGWTSSAVAEGVTYYPYTSSSEPITGVAQKVYVADIDLSKENNRVHFSYTDGGAKASEVHALHNALVTTNGTFELGSVFTKINGYKWSVLRNDTIGDTDVPNWKSEAAIYVSSAGDRVRMAFEGKNRTLDQLRSYYRSNTWPNIFSAAPMLIDDYEPVGEFFVDASLTEAEIMTLNYEDPNRHQGVRHPRTAVALTEDNHFLMIVVDGRRSGISEGMTARELTQFLVRNFNPQYALNLDGGGSSAMCVAGQGNASTHLVNAPVDNGDSERSTSTHIWVGGNA